MINLTPIQKRFLRECFEGTGYFSKNRDGRYTFSHEDGIPVVEAIVQSIIDNFDHLQYVRNEARKRIIDQSEKSMEEVDSQYPKFEREAWPELRQEIRAFNIDSSDTASTPNINDIATESGTTRLALVNSIKAKMLARDGNSNKHIGERRKRFLQIKNDPDWASIRNTHFVKPVI